MTDERWARLKACTWFGTEQAEVTAEVESLRSQVATLRSALCSIMLNTDDQCAEDVARRSLSDNPEGP